MDTHAEPGLLSSVLFSRNRRAVLGLLYGHPDQAFYLRQIVRASGGGHGAVQRELKHLFDAGILSRDVRNGMVFFQANRRCPIFEELKAILVKTAGVADFLKAAMVSLEGRIQIAFIYGSVARAQQRSDSDVDILVLGEVGFREIVSALAPAQSQVQREINPTVYSLEEFRGKLSARHHFLKNVLAKEKVFLIGDEDELERLAQECLAD